MKTVVLGVVVGVIGLGAGTAAAEPAWCKTDGVSKPNFDNVADAINSKDPLNALPSLVSVSCWPDHEARSRTKEIDASRARWSKLLDLTEADWADVAVWASAQQSSRSDTALRLDPDAKHAWSSIGPMDQFAAIHNGFPRGNHSNGYADYTYFVDALGPRLTEAGRLAYITKACLRNNSDATIVEWAVCMPDLALLDRKKLASQLRADTSRGGFDRMIVRLALHELSARIKAMEPEWKKAKAKDPAYAKMFEIAAATRKEWDELWRSEAAALDLMLAMDDVRNTSSRKLREGCEAKTWPAVQAAIGKLEAKRFDGIALSNELDSWLAHALGRVASSPQGWLALAAYHTCMGANTEEQRLSSTVGDVLAFLPGYRGPRLASQTAIMSAGLQLDDANATIEYPSIDHRARFNGQGARAFTATVFKVATKGDQVTVTFKPELEKQQECVKSRRTNRLSHISASGDIYYESICTEWRTYTVNTAPRPQTVLARFAKGVKPGVNVMIGPQLVHAVWLKGKKVPAFVLGVPVK